MNIVYSTDNNYANICLCSIISLLEANKNVENIKIYIIDNKISVEQKQNIIRYIKQYNRDYCFIDCKEVTRRLKKNNNFPVSAYARLFIQGFIEDEKVIYLDCDTIVKDDLTYLWNIDMKENWIAGVQDPLPQYLKTVVDMDKDDRYINSGVLLINLKEWRKINFQDLIIEYMKKNNNNVIHHDQGIINGVCKGKILYLEPKFNLMPEMIMMSSKQLIRLYGMKCFYSQKELDEANERPSIIHYICKFYNRPWFKECTHPYKEYFQLYYVNELHMELKEKKLGKKVRMRLFIFNHFPFEIYCINEKILNLKRIYNLRNINRRK